MMHKPSLLLSQDTISLDYINIARDFLPGFEVTKVPFTFPKLNNIQLPLVRQMGIREVITKLAEIYGCTNYKNNLVQFWFLDFMTDCLWKVQDEFQFPEEYQKVVLEWIGYFFNLLRDPKRNFRRKELFKIFNEALSIAEQHIESGCVIVPLPDALFELSFDSKEQKSETTSVQTDSSSSVDISNVSSTNKSYLALDLEDGIRFFELPEKVCPWDTEDDRLSSTVETVSENEIISVKTEVEEPVEENELAAVDVDELMIEDFYKPDMSTPARFAHSDDSLFSDSLTISYESESSETEEDEDDVTTGPPTWVIVKKKQAPELPCPEHLFLNKTEEKAKPSKKTKEEDVIQAWYDYHLWQFRKRALDDPNAGIPASEEKIDVKDGDELSKASQTIPEMDNMVLQYSLLEYYRMIQDIKELRENRFINTCVIMAIKDIFYEYFFDPFQYSLIKMAYRTPQYLVTQPLNSDYFTPKKIKREIKRPIAKKKKVEVPKKEEPQKVEPPPLVVKPSAESIVDESFSIKLKVDRTQSEIEEEQKELERAEREKSALRIQQMIDMENKTLVFPLTEAVDDQFFRNIFSVMRYKKKKN